jgi:YidC/Oxa1 family membrane protein insertase
VFGMIAKEDEAKKQEILQRRAANAPAPGARPKRNPKAASGNGSPPAGDDGTASGSPKTVADGSDGSVADAKNAKAEPDKPNPAGRNNSPSDRTPRPGARPKRRKR